MPIVIFEKKYNEKIIFPISYTVENLPKTYLYFCKLDTSCDAAKAADPPKTETKATITCNPISHGYSSGTKYTQEGPNARSKKLIVKRTDGVPGSVAAERTPNSSAFESNPNLSIVDRDSPNFSAADSNPAFSALLSNLSSSTLVSSFTAWVPLPE